MALAPTPYIKSLPDRFFVDLAVGAAPFEDICRVYDLDPATISEQSEDGFFKNRLAKAKQAVEDDGRAFRARCKTVVHDTLPRLKQIINDPEVPANSAIEAFKTLARLASLEPEPKTGVSGTGPSISFTIIAPGGDRIEQRVGPGGDAVIDSQTENNRVLTLEELAWVEA